MPTLARRLTLAGAALFLAAAPARAELLWRGDFSTGDLSQWTKTESKNVRSRLRLAADPAGAGGRALRVLVRHGDEPIGASGNRNELVWRGDDIREGVERHYAWSTFWPEGESEQPGWQIFTQWHHFEGGGSPPLAFLVRDGQVQLGTNTNEVLWAVPLERGRWHDFAFHVRWSSDPSRGLVELWYDGRIAVRRTLATLFPGQGVYLKQGLYRSTRIRADQVVFHRGMRVGTTLDDVWTPPAATTADTPSSASPSPTTSGAAEAASGTNDGAIAGATVEAGPPGGAGTGAGGCASSPVPLAALAVLALRAWRRRGRE
ncbi:MAG: hypothetical protein RL199_295 [Pseudomonadota bacterium]|jgi:hypothetical protein